MPRSRSILATVDLPEPIPPVRPTSLIMTASSLPGSAVPVHGDSCIRRKCYPCTVPELPDLFHIESVLARTVCGLRIAEVRMGDPVVLRLMVPGPLPALLMNKSITAVKRIGQFLRFSLDSDLVLVVNAMLTGRYALVSGDKRQAHKNLGKNLILVLRFDSGLELHYADETRMGKIYVAETRQVAEIPGLRDLGVELLSPEFTLQRFRALAAGRRDPHGRSHGAASLMTIFAAVSCARLPCPRNF